ncbi:MAG: hypothetical protein K1X75_01505 [Leptospirales bacterium]|nr:hypothetical protein [Leptospirales bacterium]
MQESEQIARLTQAIERLSQLLEKQGGGHSSEAGQVLLALVPLLGVVFGCTLIFFFFLWQYRIRRELIRSGQYAPVFVSNIRVLSLLIGLLAVFCGLPMTILFFLIEGVSYALLGGVLPLFAGIGFMLFYYLSFHKASPRSE